MPFNPDKINIHELTIEEPEKQAELPFDVERDISPEDLKGMERALKDLTGLFINETAKGSAISNFAAAIKILHPDIKLREDLGLKIGEWDLMYKTLKEYREGGNSPFGDGDIVDQVISMKILDPKANIGDDMRDYLENIMEGDDTRDEVRLSAAAAMKLINPKKEIILGQDRWEKIKETMRKSKEDGIWSSFLSMAKNMRIIDPNEKIVADGAVWRELHDKLQGTRNIDESSFRNDWQAWKNFAARAACMKMLAAEQVDVGGDGLEITMPKREETVEQKAPPLPETKQF